MDIMSMQFLSALLAIIVIDLVLAGDNAIVIALAARNVPKHLQKRAICGARWARSSCAPRSRSSSSRCSRSRAAVRRRAAPVVDRLQAADSGGGRGRHDRPAARRASGARCARW
jgi:hypothetical protein